VTEAQALRASFEIDQKAGKFVIFSDLTRWTGALPAAVPYRAHSWLPCQDAALFTRFL